MNLESSYALLVHQFCTGRVKETVIPNLILFNLLAPEVTFVGDLA